MALDPLELLSTAMPAELPTVVRLDQRRPDFQITEWTVARLSRQGMAHPGGLFCFSGTGWAGAEPRSWSVILKLLHQPAVLEDPRDIWYWKRELLAAAAGLTLDLPGPLRVPRIYAAADQGMSGRLWLEHIHGLDPPQWTVEHYVFAAREIGRTNGAGVGAVPQADAAWLATEHCRWWMASVHNPTPEVVWGNPYVAAAFAPLRPRIAALWAERERFLAVLEQLPQVVSHFDLHRRNLFIRQGLRGAAELVAIDWGFVGSGALGGDLFALIGSSALLGELALETVAEVEATAYAAYIGGLRDAGWRGDPDQVRLAYTLWFALWVGAVIADCTAFWTAGPTDEAPMRQFGCSREALAADWASVCARALDHGDEARRLIAKLRLGPEALTAGGV